MKNTSIQWADDTINPTSGCDGCELYRKPPAGLTEEQLKAWLRDQECYASQVHENRLARSFPHNYARSFGEVRLIPGRLQQCAGWRPLAGKDRPDKPWLNGMPRLIFISDMSDALSAAVPFEFLAEEIITPVISWQKAGHVGMWLTKRPERMLKFAAWLHERGVKWPDNLWAGTSVTNQSTANARIPHIVRMKLGGVARVFVSYEPARAEVDFDQRSNLSPADCDAGWMEYLDLIIVGGESGRNARPFDVDIAYNVIRQCREFGVAPFVKQLGATAVRNVEPTGKMRTFAGRRQMQLKCDELQLKDTHGGDWSEWPQDLRVREMPNATKTPPVA